MITQEYLKTILEYNENTGIFTWIKERQKIKVGSIAGSRHSRGYIHIGINNKRYLAHRLVLLYIHGEWPSNQIDHINGIKDDNRIDNLRNVTNRENHQNRKVHRNGKLVGCYFHKIAKKWEARIKINKKQIHLGLYTSERLANEAYLAMEWLLFEVEKL